VITEKTFFSGAYASVGTEASTFVDKTLFVDGSAGVFFTPTLKNILSSWCALYQMLNNVKANV
jgi:hypothetical protein